MVTAWEKVSAASRENKLTREVMAEKCSLPFNDVSDMTSTSLNENVQDVPTRLSHMKKSWTVGKVVVRLFSFGSGVHQQLADFEEWKQAAAISNYEMKQSCSYQLSSDLKRLEHLWPITGGDHNNEITQRTADEG